MRRKRERELTKAVEALTVAVNELKAERDACSRVANKAVFDALSDFRYKPVDGSTARY